MSRFCPAEKAAEAVQVLRLQSDLMIEHRNQLSKSLHSMEEQVRIVAKMVPLSADGLSFLAHINQAIEHLNMMEIGGLSIESDHYREDVWPRIP